MNIEVYANVVLKEKWLLVGVRFHGNMNRGIHGNVVLKEK